MKTSLTFTIICAVLLISCNGTLDIVEIGAPAVNFIFDTDGTITMRDTSDEITLVGMSGSGFLQSRTLPVGEAGTVGAGLYAYQYRIDLRQMFGLTFIAGVMEFSLDFGPVSSLDYDGDGNADDVYVVTTGGVGNVAPSSVEISGSRLTFRFNPSVAAGSGPGNGESSFFFGLASTSQPHHVAAEIKDTEANTYILDARAPNFVP